MEITEEDRNELGNLLKIATSQIPRYDINECIFGMVFEKYVHDSGQYMTNKGIDDGQPNSIENSMEAYNTGIDVFSENVPEIKRLIQEASS
jgi:hypothetical protein